MASVQEKGSPCAAGGLRAGTAAAENSMQAPPQNLKTELPSAAALAVKGMHRTNAATVIKKQMRLRV